MIGVVQFEIKTQVLSRSPEVLKDKGERIKAKVKRTDLTFAFILSSAAPSKFYPRCFFC